MRNQNLWIAAIVVAVLVAGGLVALFSSSWWTQRGLSACTKAAIGQSEQEVLSVCRNAEEITTSLEEAKRSGYTTSVLTELVEGGLGDPSTDWESRGGWQGQTGPPAVWALMTRACNRAQVTTGACSDLPSASACEEAVLNLRQNQSGVAEGASACFTRAEFEAARRMAIEMDPCPSGTNLADQRRRCWTYGGIRSSEIALLRDGCEYTSSPLCREVTGAPLSASEREEQVDEEAAAARRAERRARDLICSNFPNDPGC